MSVYIDGVQVGTVETVGVTDTSMVIMSVIGVALVIFLVIALIRTLGEEI